MPPGEGAALIIDEVRWAETQELERDRGRSEEGRNDGEESKGAY